MKGIILEGVSGSGKSLLAAALQKYASEHHPQNTKVFLSEHLTERVNEDIRKRGELSEAGVLDHLDNLLALIEGLGARLDDSWLDERGRNTEPLVLVERFLLSHMTNLKMADPMSWQSAEVSRRVNSLQARIRQVGLVTVVLQLPDPLVLERVRDARLHRSGGWGAFLDSIGDDEAVSQHFVNWQKLLVDSALSMGTTRKLTSLTPVARVMMRAFSQSWHLYSGPVPFAIRRYSMGIPAGGD